MTLPLTVPPKSRNESFLWSPVVTDLDALDADIAILGIPYGNPYSIEDVTNDQSNAPTAIREASDRAVRSLERYDFDLGGTLFAGKPINMADCGNVPADVRNLKGHSWRAEQVVRKILSKGALPIVFGGDHAISIPVLRAYEGRGPITLVQIDAHIDWRDEVDGVREGLCSPIRRASEMEHIDRIFQIGIRSQGNRLRIARHRHRCRTCAHTRRRALLSHD
jgi:agmatinase